MPERLINEHLDSGCSSSKDPSSLGPRLALPASQTSSISSHSRTSSFSKASTSIHPLFQRRTEHHEPSALISSQPGNRKRVAGVSHPESSSSSSTFGHSQSVKRPRISSNNTSTAPLAERLRPGLLTDFVGQAHLTEAGSMLLSSMKNGSLGSMIFWGPPGCGKTTLARLVAKQTNSIFKELSATIVGINEVRKIFEDAKNEVHRFSKSQQDVFLPFLEHGDIQLIGATTENPSFKLTGALLSRCRVFVLERLSDANIEEIIGRAMTRLSPAPENISSGRPALNDQGDSLSDSGDDRNFPLTPDLSQIPESSPPVSGPSQFPAYPHFTARVLASVVSLSSGDARTALSLLDLVLSANKLTREEKLVENLRRSVSSSYDRSADDRYDMISALHKSVRGSDVDGAMYWLARMLSVGEDPMYIARRMVVCASEDIGLADHHALPLATAALQACQVIGMPECRINLAHVVAYLAEAPKSTRAYEAYNRAETAAKSNPSLPVPMIARNAPTSLMKEMGYSEGYMYNPDYAHPVHNAYLPPEIDGQRFMRPPGEGKLWNEEALLEWERKRNDGKDWEGRPKYHT
ncbi:hypothetical protein D9757_004365 [Collybiopsis confluens]|uniref:AAA+ ATPase domain-containing protein n=1 Tax=Collybiopsis confluens TaxID=2823264 RepID=A0A8H5MCW5_9AGAR|nr:hypothetical protein D9757_004365 [Collybiopsis confluens]